MARTIRTKVYQFSELSKDAQKKAIEWYKTVLNQDSDILFGFDEECEEIAKENGFDDIKLQYSFSYSQGDGLSFRCDNFNFKKFLDNNSRLGTDSLRGKVILNNATVKITGNTGRYCFASRSDIDMYLEVNKDYPNIESLIDLVKSELQDKYIALCKELEDIGYKWIESRYTDENIIEDIEANEYEFTKEGNRFC